MFTKQLRVFMITLTAYSNMNRYTLAREYYIIIIIQPTSAIVRLESISLHSLILFQARMFIDREIVMTYNERTSRISH